MRSIFYLCNSVTYIKCVTDSLDSKFVWVAPYSIHKKKMFSVEEEIKGNGWTYESNVDMDGRIVDDFYPFIKEDANYTCHNFIRWYNRHYDNESEYYYKMNKKDDRIESIDIYMQGYITIGLSSHNCVICRCGSITDDMVVDIQSKIGNALKKYDYFYADENGKLCFANFDNDDNCIIEVDVTNNC